MRKHITVAITTVCFIIGMYGGNRLVTRKK